ncbi:hypothetical protein ABH935_009311 [Catenulispora sp. GAS73]|uniref:DUF2961 domain-containing protein n=1 Tax=Catenulispora sp. GAS73 TaxID=3156269 RepID=UPI00351384CB
MLSSAPPPAPSRRRRWRVLSGLAAIALAAVTAGLPTTAVAAPKAAVATAKGPVGWDTLRRLDEFANVPQGVQVKQFSSFDRGQHNLDLNNCLRGIGTGGCVMAEASGPGEVDSIWLTGIATVNGANDFGNVANMGNIVIVLDGKTIVNASLQSVVNGSLGAPFVYPLVANASQSSGGVYIDVPMPYTSSMLIYTTAAPSPDYYHVDYRTYADATGVTTFDPSDTAPDVLAMLNAAGTADPKSVQAGATTATAGPFTLAPGASQQVATVSGPASLSALRLTLPQLAPPPSQVDPADDGRAFGSGGSSSFTLAVDPANQGVRLTKRLDASIANQVMNVAVDGTVVGQWAALPQSLGNYVDEAVDLPVSATGGKSSITVTNTFVSSTLDVNEFHYWADSLVNGLMRRTDSLDVGPNHTADESAHHYSIAKETWEGTRGLGALRYAPNSVPQLTDDGRAFGAGGSSRFTVAINPANNGVILTRRYDSSIPNQVANVTVNGVALGQWKPTSVGPNGQFWADESLTVPASISAGQTSLTVTNTFASSYLDFNEFHYWADSIVNGNQQRTDTVDVGNTASEGAHAYTIANQTWSGTRTVGYVPSAVVDSNAILTGARIRISFDGAQTVDAPLGEFFGSSRYDAQVRSLMTGMDPTNGLLSAWWPMPFGSTAVVTMYNGGQVPLSGVGAQVTSAPCSTCGSQLSSGQIGYFHATSHSMSAAQQITGQDYTILTASGRGKFAGVALGMAGPSSPAYSRNYLEGNERVYVDGSRGPNPNGTGTEDYFDSGWFFANGPATLPFNGNPSHQAGTYGCPANVDCTSAYRLTVNDAVPFDSSINYGIEHGASGPMGDNVVADYSSTAFWYGVSSVGQKTTDTLTVGDPASEASHGYTSGSAAGNIGRLTDTFEGNDGAPTPVPMLERTTQSAVSFNLAVDPANAGVTLIRSSDQEVGYQQAVVTVNGQAAGTWLEPFANPFHRLLDDSFQIPVPLTAGQSSLAVTITPSSGSPAWSAAQYRALSQVAPFADTTAPSAVSAAAVHATDSGSTLVTWAPATDDVGVDHYAVYAAQGAAPAIDAAHLVGTAHGPSFAHTGLASGQNWHYRVAAVDATGNAGAASPDVAVTVTAPVKIEAESLVGSATGTAPAVAQSNCCNVTWSGNAELWMQATAPGQFTKVTFNVPVAGRYDLSAVQTTALDYGIVSVALDGAAVGGPFDGYAPTVRITNNAQEYGAVDLSAGSHTLTLTASAKDPWAINYYAGFDYLVLSPSS